MDCGSVKILPHEKYPLYGNHTAIRSCTFLSGVDFPATVHVGSTSTRQVAIMRLPVQQTHHCKICYFCCLTRFGDPVDMGTPRVD